MAPHVTISEGIASAALILSLYSTARTIGFSKRQHKLNQLLIDKQHQDVLLQKQADVSASFVNLGRSNYRLRVFNKGKATATNVRLDFPNGNELVIATEIAEKFPMASLEPYQSVELIAAVCMESPRKLDIKFIWNDPSADDRQKTMTATL
jgi:hypothetical protein